jgi:hypothetical protein
MPRGSSTASEFNCSAATNTVWQSTEMCDGRVKDRVTVSLSGTLHFAEWSTRHSMSDKYDPVTKNPETAICQRQTGEAFLFNTVNSKQC